MSSTNIYNKYQYRLLEFLDRLPYKIRLSVKREICAKLNIHPGTLQAWIYQTKNTPRSISAKSLVVIADFFSKALLEPVSVEDMFTDQIDKINFLEFKNESLKKIA